MDPKLTPVDHDPFAEGAPPAGKLTPVDHDPFATPPKEYAAADVPLEAANNLLPSIGKQFSSMGDALMHPIDTATSVGKLAASPVLNPLAMGALMLSPHLPESIREKVRAMAKSQLEPTQALQKDYGDAYGGWENVKRTAAEDPARLLMDLSLPFTGAAGAPGKLGKAAGVVGKAVDTPGLIQKGLTATTEALPAEVVGTTTATGSGPFREAASTGFNGGQAGVDFRKALRDGAPTDQIVATAKQGLQTMKDRMMSVYQTLKDDPTHGWAKDPTVLNFTPIETAWQKLQDTYKTRSGRLKVGDSEWGQIQDIGKVIDEWKNDPTSHTVEGLDGLKQRIADFADSKTAHPQVVRATTRMANAVKDEIVKQAPGYAEAMKHYSQASKAMEEMESALSLGKNSSAQTAMSKLQSVMRNNANTQYGHRLDKLAQLEHEGLIDLTTTLAGHALNSWAPRGIARGVMSAGVPAAGAALATGVSLPTAGAGLAGLAMTSPRLMGELVHGGARAAGVPFRAARWLGSKMPAGYSSLPNDVLREVSAAPFSYPGRQAERIIGEERPEERKRGGYFAGRA